MHIGVVWIGNSCGISIPKRILEQLKISDTLDMEVDGDRIILEPVHRKPREGWAAAARQMRAAGDDRHLIPDVFEGETEVDW